MHFGSFRMKDTMVCIPGNQPNNNRAIETQLMDRFLRDNFGVELYIRAS